MSLSRDFVLIIVALQLGATSARAQSSQTASTTPATAVRSAGDSAAIVLTVNRFHAFLEAGDTLSAARLLAPDLVVLESGDIESRSQYLSHHLHADAEFAKAMPGGRRLASVSQKGDVAWTISESTSRGTFRNRPVNSKGAELMVLIRSDSGWMISAIHWSSRRIAP